MGDLSKRKEGKSLNVSSREGGKKGGTIPGLVGRVRAKGRRRWGGGGEPRGGEFKVRSSPSARGESDASFLFERGRRDRVATPGGGRGADRRCDAFRKRKGYPNYSP